MSPIELIQEIRDELGDRFEYTQEVNEHGILMCSVRDTQTGWWASGNRVHFGADAKEDARSLLDYLITTQANCSL
jgi:hypothetical protein